MTARPQDLEAGAEADVAVLSDRLHSVAIRLLRTLRGEDQAMGLSGPRASALSVLVFRGPLSVTELATVEQVRPPTMTRLVQGLEADGLVRRTPVPSDRRVTRIRATAQGRRLLEDGRRRRVGALTGRLSGLSGAARNDIERAVSVLEEVLGARAAG